MVPACVVATVNTACTGTNFIYAGGYIGGFNPASICTNNVASVGSSGPTATNLDVVASEVTANTGCSAYTLTLTGCPLPVELQRFSIE